MLHYLLTGSSKMVRILSSGEIVPDDDPRLNRQTDNRERRPQVRRP